MDFAFNPEEEAFRAELVSFLEQELSEDQRTAHLDFWDQAWVDEDLEHQFRRRLSATGMLAMAWPEEYGGKGRKGSYNSIIAYEMARANAPGIFHGVRIVGPSLMIFGSEEQRKFFLPKIAQGELEFVLGYSEPGAGTDLGNLQTRAEADGDEFVITGQKIFTTGAHRADYCWMVARTNQDVPKHKGISIFLVPFDT
ncbi:acyl-CoA dehydrogenase family protein, partial [Dehalococcoidia bacterium]|nr:acyl-CoA dehydrogenase family protein [Dehalococcoidia bacterium]